MVNKLMQSPWKFFTLEELKCKCGQCGSTGNEMIPEFMVMIVAIRKEADFPFVITSAYRCPEYNAKVSDTGPNGPHTTGMAMDIKCDGEQAWHILNLAYHFSMPGVGVRQKEGEARYVHLDDCDAEKFPRPRAWSY